MLFIMLVWGFNVIAIKILVTNFSPIMITSLRIFMAFLSLCPLLIVLKHFRALSKKEFFLVLLAGMFLVFGHQIFLAVGLQNTTAANGGLILGLVPIFTSIAGILLLGERMTLLRILGMVSGFIGVVIIVLAGSSSSFRISIGDLYMFLSVISQVFGFIFISKASKTVSSTLLTALTLMIGSIMLFIGSLGLEPGGLSTLKNTNLIHWAVFFASAIIGSGLGQTIYNFAIRHIGSGKTALFLNLPPFFTLVGAYFILGEEIIMSQWLGFIFIISGVLLGTGIVEELLKNRALSRKTAA